MGALVDLDAEPLAVGAFQTSEVLALTSS